MEFTGLGNKWHIMASSYKFPKYIKDCMKQFPPENGYKIEITIRKCFMKIEVNKE